MSPSSSSPFKYNVKFLPPTPLLASFDVADYPTDDYYSSACKSQPRASSFNLLSSLSVALLAVAPSSASPVTVATGNVPLEFDTTTQAVTMILKELVLVPVVDAAARHDATTPSRYVLGFPHDLTDYFPCLTCWRGSPSRDRFLYRPGGSRHCVCGLDSPRHCVDRAARRHTSESPLSQSDRQVMKVMRFFVTVEP
jgi:hypothetical protein